MRDELQPYRNLMQDFVGGSLPVAAFEPKFFARYKNDGTQWSEAEFKLLETVFYALDCYCGDPALRDAADIDEPRLRQIVADAVRQM